MMARMTFLRKCLDLLIVAALFAVPVGARGDFREIEFQGEEWWATPWCYTWDNGSVFVPVKDNMQVNDEGYYHFSAYGQNNGSDTCVADLEYAHFPRGTAPGGGGSTDGASEVRIRSFLITPGDGGWIDSGPVGYCVAGEGGHLQLNTWLDPDLSLELWWPDGTTYWGVAINFPCY